MEKKEQYYSHQAGPEFGGINTFFQTSYQKSYIN